MPGQRIRLLLIAVIAVGLCNYKLLTGRSRSKPTLNPRVIDSNAGNTPAADSMPTTTQAGFNRFPAQQREQETTIRPRVTATVASPAQARTVDALGKEQLLAVVQQAIDKTSRRYLDVESFTPWQMMHGVLALRGDYKLKQGGKVINGIDFISSGPTYRGDYWWERTSAGGRGHPYSVPYHFEGHINQFPALLSMSALPLDHQLVAKGGTITVADIVRNAQRTVNTNEELTWTLWLLTQYISQDETWVNQQGQRWSMADLVRLQVADGVNDAPCGGTHQLFALAFARNAYLKQHGQLRGVWVNAEYKLRTHIEYARQLQNSDGSFSTNFFKGGGYTADFKDRIRTSGHMLEWLMMALPASRLDEPWVRRGIQSVANDLIRNASAPAECGPMYHALHALVLFRERAAPSESTPAREQLATAPKPTPAPQVAANQTTPAVPPTAKLVPPAPTGTPKAPETAKIVDSAPQPPASSSSTPGIVVLSPAAPATTSQQPVVVVKTREPDAPAPAMLSPAEAKPITMAQSGDSKASSEAGADSKAAARSPLVLKKTVEEPVVESKVAATTPPQTDAEQNVAAAASPEAAPPANGAAMPNPPTNSTTTVPSSSLVKSDAPSSPTSVAQTEQHPDDLPLADIPMNHPADLPTVLDGIPSTPAPSVVAAADDRPILPEVSTDAVVTAVPSAGPVTGLTIEPEAASGNSKPAGKPRIADAPEAPVRVSDAANAEETVVR